MLVLSYLQPRIKWMHVCICLLAPLVGSGLPDSAFHTELHLLPSINSTKTGQPCTHSSEWDSLPRWCLVAMTWQLELGSTTPMLRQERIHAPAASFQSKWATVALLSRPISAWNSGSHLFLPTQSHVCSEILNSSPFTLYWIILSL